MQIVRPLRLRPSSTETSDRDAKGATRRSVAWLIVVLLLSCILSNANAVPGALPIAGLDAESENIQKGEVVRLNNGLFARTSGAITSNFPPDLVRSPLTRDVSKATLAGSPVISSTQSIGGCSRTSASISMNITGTTDDGSGLDNVYFSIFDDGVKKVTVKLSVPVGTTKLVTGTASFDGLYGTSAPGIGISVFDDAAGTNRLFSKDPVIPTDIAGAPPPPGGVCGGPANTQNAESINPSSPQTLTVVDPIVVASGAHSISVNGLQAAGRLDLGFTLAYSSLSPVIDSGVGKGWTHRYGATIRVLGIDASITWPSGRVTNYQKFGGNWYNLNADFNDKLTENADGTWLLLDSGRTKHEFTAAGTLTKQTSRTGVVLNYTYAAGKLQTVTDPVSGRSLTFVLDASNRIKTVTAPDGSKAQLAYSAAGDLTNITNAAGGVLTYTYDANHRVLTGTNELTQQFFANQYDAQGRVVAQDDGVAASPTTLLAYVDTATTHKTTITDRNGKVTVYEFDAQYRPTKITDATGAVSQATYDANGNVLTRTDANGKLTTSTDDARGNPVTITDAAGRSVTMTYDGNDNLLTVKDAAGNVTTYAYDANNRMTTRTDALGKVTSYAYNADSQVTKVTLPNGGSINSTYVAGQLATMTDATGNVTTFAYDVNGRVNKVTDAMGSATTFTYNAMGRVLTTTNALGHVVNNVYDARGRLTSRTDPRGGTTAYTYNGNDKPITITNAMGQVTAMEYDLEDRISKVTDPLGNATTFTYNARGDQTLITDVLGRSVSKTIDAAGVVTAITNGAGNTATFNFDDSYALKQSKDGLNNATTLTRDSAARVSKTTDALGRNTQFTYDALSRLAQSTDALGGTASQTFDVNGNLTSMTDPRGNSTAFAFDTQGRMLTITTPEGSVVAATYNPRGQFAKVTNARGQAANFTYDAAGRLTQRSDPTGTIRYTYDANGNPLTVSDSVGSITRVFDALNRPTSYTSAHGKTIGYRYDAAGNAVEITYPDGKKVSYTYNAANQLATVTDWASRVTRYAYDAAGRLNGVTQSNSKTVALTYDAAGRLTAYTDSVNPNSYAFDAVGNITRETNPNLVQPPLGSTSMTYDAANRVTTFNGTTVTYDADGNMTRGPVGPLGAPVFADFTWDSRNRLLAVSGGGGNSYVYDAENHRLQADTTRYVINPHVRLSQVLMETDASGTPSAWYVYGLGLIGREDAAGYRAYHYDRRGSTVALTDAAGAVTDTYRYGPYGELVAKTGSLLQPFAYNGRDGVMTSVEGMTFQRSRYRSEATRQFLSKDSAWFEGPQRYAFLSGSPLDQVDPFGLYGFSDVLGDAWSFTKGTVKLLYGGATAIAGELRIGAGYAMCTTVVLCGLGMTQTVAGVTDFAEGSAAAGAVLQNTVVEVANRLGANWSYATKDDANMLKSAVGLDTYKVLEWNQTFWDFKDVVNNGVKWFNNGVYDIGGAVDRSILSVRVAIDQTKHAIELRSFNPLDLIDDVSVVKEIFVDPLTAGWSFGGLARDLFSKPKRTASSASGVSIPSAVSYSPSFQSR